MLLLSISLSLFLSVVSCHYISPYIAFESLEATTTTILSIDRTHQDNNIATSVSICLLRLIRCGLLQVDGDDDNDWHERIQLVFFLSRQTTTLNSNPLKCLGLSVRNSKYWCTMAERFGMLLSNYSLDLPMPASFSDLEFSARRPSSTKYCTTSVKTSQCTLKGRSVRNSSRRTDKLGARV